jgi:hypothetical protein
VSAFFYVLRDRFPTLFPMLHNKKGTRFPRGLCLCGAITLGALRQYGVFIDVD